MNTSIYERFEEVSRYYGLSLRQLSVKLSLSSPQIFYDLKSGKVKSISGKILESIKSHLPDINTGWLLTGEGRMLKGPYERINQILSRESSTEEEFAQKSTTILSALSGFMYSQAKKRPGDTKTLKQWIKPLLEAYPQYSEEWIITGKGEMLKSPSTATQTEKRLIPLYADVTSIGGNNGSSADVSTPYGNILEWIDAGDWFPGATAAIHHYGDSMVEYPSGCILALKRVEDTRLIINGKAYVIETDEFRITKQLQYDGGDYLMAYSSNNAKYDDGRLIHAPIRIPMDAVRHIDLVIGYVVKEFSNGAIPIIKDTSC